MTYSQSKEFLDWYVTKKYALLDKTKEILFKNHIEKSRPTIYQPIFHMLNSPGKMLRGILTLLSHELCGGNSENILTAAASLELAHQASLIHDDILDSAELRRGITSIHKKFSIHDALLSGDLLIFYACYGVTLSKVNATRITQAIQIASCTAINIIYGQHLEFKLRGDLGIKLEEYLQIIDLKTASLVQACCQIGSVLAGASKNEISILTEYGKNLGMAFQIKDDLLSLEKKNEFKTKSKDVDLKNNIITIPIILALKTGDQTTIKKIQKIYQKKSIQTKENNQLISLIEKEGAITESLFLAKEYAKKAISAAQKLSSRKHQNKLIELAEIVIQREF